MADAAYLLAVDELPDREIAAKVGVDPGQIWRWKRHPEFVARVNKHKDELGECAQRYAIGRQADRLRSLDDRRRRLHQLIEARAADPRMAKVAGGSTGLLARDVKGVGKGDYFQLIPVYRVDTGLLSQLLAHERQAAQEISNWAQKIALTNPDGTEQYSPTGFTADEVVDILEGLAARLGVAVDGPDPQGPEDAAGQHPAQPGPAVSPGWDDA